jgi:hypothetical protein
LIALLATPPITAMLIPIRKRDGLVYQELICDACRKRIDEADFPSATVDFSPISQARLQHATAEELQAATVQRHFHMGCAPSKCTGESWQKLHRVMYAMAANIFNAKGSTIAAAASEVRVDQGIDPCFP